MYPIIDPSMIDIEQWEKDASNENKEAIEHIIKTIDKGSAPSLLDLAPQFKDALKDDTYGWWRPPNEIDDLKNPARRLITALTSVFSPEAILIPLYYRISSKGQFAKLYGLNEQYGIVYEDFLDLVKVGRIRIIIPSLPSSYTSDFYQEIFQKCIECEQGAYRPPQYQARFLTVTSFSELKQKLGSKLNKETYTKALECDEFHIDYWQNRAKISLKTNIRSLSQREIELHSRSMGTDASELYHSGFHNFVNFLFEKLERDPRLLQRALSSYTYYLIDGYSYGLGGLRFYTHQDVERMSFYRLLPRGKHEELRNLIKYSPAATTVITDPIDSLLISRPDHEEIKKALKLNRDCEVKKEITEMQQSVHDINFINLITKSKRIDEIVSERINQETLKYFKESKLIKLGVRIGGTLGFDLVLEAASTIATAGTMPFGLSSLLGVAIEETVFGKQLENVGQSLAKKWVFREKGLPSVIWELSQNSKK